MRREQRGEYLIEASAARLPGNKWQPRLVMIRLAVAPALQRCQGFPGLSPAFETAEDATRFALDLGRQFADHGSSRLTI